MNRVIKRPRRSQQHTLKMVQRINFPTTSWLAVDVLQHCNIAVCVVITDSSSPNLYLEAMDGNVAQSGGVKASVQTLPSKDQERLRPASAGHNAPSMVPPGPSSSFPRPIYPLPLLSHVPMVRPHPQLHPNVVQRMLAQGIQPQHVGPALVQGG